MNVNHDEYKTDHSCIPVRSAGAGGESHDENAAGYFIAVRPKELTVYQWPFVRIHTTAPSSSCKKLSTRPYDEIIFNYTEKKTVNLLSQGTQNYGGAKVPKGHLLATIRNFEPEPEAIPVNARASGSIELKQDWSEERAKLSETGQTKFPVEVGLLEALQVSVNSTLAKCNIVGQQMVFIKNSALYNSFIESLALIHTSGGCQIEGSMISPYVFLDTDSMIESNSSIEADTWFQATGCHAFDKNGRMSTSEGYGISNVEISTLCVSISDSTMSECNISSPQTSLEDSYMNNCIIACAKMNDSVMDSRRATTLPRLVGANIIGIDKLRENLVVYGTKHPAYGVPSCGWPEYTYNDQGEYWSESCIATNTLIQNLTEENPNHVVASPRTISSSVMLRRHPYARTNEDNAADLGYILEPEDPNEKLKFIGTSHGFSRNTFVGSSIELGAGVLYSSANTFDSTLINVPHMALNQSNSLTNHCSIISESLYSYDESNINMQVSFSSLDIGGLYSVNLIDQQGSDITLHQASLGKSFSSEGSLYSSSTSNIKFTASEFTLSNLVPGRYEGNYEFNHLTLESTITFGKNQPDNNGSVSAGKILGYGAIFNADVVTSDMDLKFIRVDEYSNISAGTIAFGGGFDDTGFVNGGVVEASKILAFPKYSLFNTNKIKASSLDSIIENSALATIEADIIDARSPSTLAGKITAGALYIHRDDVNSFEITNNLQPTDKLSVGILTAESCTIETIPPGSNIKEATVHGSICSINWVDLGTKSCKIIQSVNKGTIDNAEFEDSIHASLENSVLSNSNFTKYFSISTSNASGKISINSGNSKDIPEYLPSVPSSNTLDIRFAGLGSHSIEINDSNLLPGASISLDTLLTEDGYEANTLSVSFNSSFMENASISATTINLKNTSMFNGTVTASQTITLESSHFVGSSISSQDRPLKINKSSFSESTLSNARIESGSTFIKGKLINSTYSGSSNLRSDPTVFDIEGTDIEGGTYDNASIKDAKLKAGYGNLLIGDSSLLNSQISESNEYNFVHLKQCSIVNLTTDNNTSFITIEKSSIHNLTLGGGISPPFPLLIIKSKSINKGPISMGNAGLIECQGMINEGSIDCTTSANTSILFNSSTNSKSIQARQISMNKGVNKGTMTAINSQDQNPPGIFNFSTGSTNIGEIIADLFKGFTNSSVIGRLVQAYNENEDTIRLLTSENDLSINTPYFFFDYGPYYDLEENIEVSTPKGIINTKQSLIPFDFENSASNISNFDSYISSSDPQCLEPVNTVTISNQYYINGQRNGPHVNFFHPLYTRYKFTGVPDEQPIGFSGNLPAGFHYTGSKLIGLHNGVNYYSGTITITVTAPFDGEVEFSSLYGGNDYKGSFAYNVGDVCSTLDPNAPDDSSDDPNPLDPPVITNSPGGISGPHGTKTNPTYNPSFGIRVFYASYPVMKSNNLGSMSPVRDTYFVEGIPFEGTNVRENESFKGYIFNQIIYPHILQTYFSSDLNELAIPFITAKDYNFPSI